MSAVRALDGAFDRPAVAAAALREEQIDGDIRSRVARYRPAHGPSADRRDRDSGAARGRDAQRVTCDPAGGGSNRGAADRQLDFSLVPPNGKRRGSIPRACAALERLRCVLPNPALGRTDVDPVDRRSRRRRDGRGLSVCGSSGDQSDRDGRRNVRAHVGCRILTAEAVWDCACKNAGQTLTNVTAGPLIYSESGSNHREYGDMIKFKPGRLVATIAIAAASMTAFAQNSTGQQSGA